MGEWIEEGMFWRGPAAPEPCRDWKTGDWIELPHEHFIPVPKARLIKALSELPQASEAKVPFEHFLQLSEALFHFHYHKTLNELEEDYEYFSPDGGALARAGVSEQELDERERRFVTNFLQAMVRGSFVPLGQEFYARATEQDYLLDVPVEPNWAGHDQRLLAGFYEWADGKAGAGFREALGLGPPGSLREFLDPPAEIGANALVFYRGLDRDQTGGLFVQQKLDKLIELLFKVLLFPILIPLELLISTLRGGREAVAARPSASGAERSTVFERRWVRRLNLANVPLLRSLFRPLRLQEPALRQVITLFRLLPRPSLLGKVESFRKKAHAELPERDRTIRIKTFSHIPLADAEIVFPEKTLRMRSFDMAMLIITALGAIPALAKGFTQGGGAAFAVVAVLGAFAWKLFSRYRRVKRDYEAQVMRDLYDKSLDNSMGVLQFLVDSLEAQEFKETALIYAILLGADAPLTAAEIDGRIEQFLAERFGVEIDYEVEDALAKVIGEASPRGLTLPIVEAVGGEGDTRYRAKPLSEALGILDGHWDGLFDYSPSVAAGA